MNYINECIFVKAMQPFLFDQLAADHGSIRFARGAATLSNNINIADGLYSCMLYEHRRIITMITNGLDSEVIVLVFRDNDDYSRTVQMLKTELTCSISIQDGKLISYARSISEKLRIGTEVKVQDAVKDENFITCPCCGVKNDKNSGFPFCLECGEPL